MKCSVDASPVRKIDDTLSIVDFFPAKNMSFDCVLSKLSGKHGFCTNKVSDRGYFILSGSGVAIVEDEEFRVSKNDFVVIEKGKKHGIIGNLEFLVITSPPFCAANEVHSDD